jgi:prepilin-type N-terminal cleavage/methylation domain-containing protein
MRIPPRIARLREEDGFTLIELTIVMAVLTIGILSLVAAYSSGYVAMKHATRVSSAQLLADSQMERFRALSYTSVALNTTCGANCSEDATYTADTAYSSTAQISGCATQDQTCLPSQTKAGPDGNSYRMDTYIAWSCLSGTFSTSPSPTCGATATIPLKLITLVVRQSGTTAVLVREQSTFTSATGS